MSTITLSSSTSRGSDFELAYASPIILKAKGADVESISRHESKRSQQRAYSDESGKLTSDGRKRRSRGSSDDEGQLTFDGLSNEDLRVGGPYLCSLPVKTITIAAGDPLYPIAEVDSHIMEQVHKTLAQHNMHRVLPALVKRRSHFNPENEPIPTILLLATRQKVDNEWLHIVREIRDYLVQAHLQEVSVEIADPEIFKPPHISPVLKTDPIFDKWDELLNVILREINLQDIGAIGCFRRGRSTKTTDNPPTVLFTVSTKSNKSWKSSRDFVVKILDRFRLPMVAVEYVKDEIHHTCFRNKGIDRELLKGKARIGQSLGISGDDSSSGTLGSFVELQRANGSWQPFALTCFHCVMPEEYNAKGDRLEAIRRWRRHGVRPGDNIASQQLKVEHPSEWAMIEQIEAIDDGIERATSDQFWKRCQRAISDGTFQFASRSDTRQFESEKKYVTDQEQFREEIRQFRRHHGHNFGYVVAGSGFKTKKPVPTMNNAPYSTSMDWALMHFYPGRNGYNTLKDHNLIRQVLPSDRQLGHGNDLFIEEFRSGRSAGRYNGLKTAHIHQMVDSLGRFAGTEKTLEHCIVGEPSKFFSQKGDSGSCVFTRDYSMAGMVWAGHVAQDITYFTHVHDLVEDIKQVTGARGMRMWIPDRPS
ncbi:uncharacterized protein N7459_007595 [Penicillium hispanicum]|uniref:uncharacterized protein n=1 Tax=Penicillium hispanicum TaxID=1080232 RepID=UPI00253FC15A|nr:uncharacterized protein N7459_007595 [Penicillium hispanicum]KAJ5578631.1 hypothetical protein N7459_007595 [Penicillium hispanicum]